MRFAAGWKMRWAVARTPQPNPLTIRPSGDERTHWEAQAAAAGMPLNRWVRVVCNTACKGLLPSGQRCAHAAIKSSGQGAFCDDCGEQVA